MDGIASEEMKRIKAAGDIGRQLADMAVLIFGPNALQNGKNEQVASPSLALVTQGFRAEICLPASPGLRASFDAALMDGLPEIFPDWLGLSAEDRDYLRRVAGVVFDRRLAMHEAACLLRGGQA